MAGFPPCPVACREEPEGFSHPFLKEDVSIPQPLRRTKQQEQSLRRFGRGDGLLVLPPRGKQGPLKGCVPERWAPGDGDVPSSAHVAPGKAFKRQERRRGASSPRCCSSNGKQIPASVLFPQEALDAACSREPRLRCSAFYRQGNRILELTPSCLSEWINEINRCKKAAGEESNEGQQLGNSLGSSFPPEVS